MAARIGSLRTSDVYRPPPTHAAVTTFATHAKRKAIVRAVERRAGGFRPAIGGQRRVLAISPAQPARMHVHRLWGGLMRACGGRGAGLRGYARFRALGQRELHVQRCESREAAPRRRSEHWADTVRRGRRRATLALSRATGRCAVHCDHRRQWSERHAPPPQSGRRPHGGRSATRPGDDVNRIVHRHC